jgi:hypothetical protein
MYNRAIIDEHTIIGVIQNNWWSALFTAVGPLDEAGATVSR